MIYTGRLYYVTKFNAMKHCPELSCHKISHHLFWCNIPYYLYLKKLVDFCILYFALLVFIPMFTMSINVVCLVLIIHYTI